MNRGRARKMSIFERYFLRVLTPVTINGTPGYADTALFVQGRRHSVESTDDSLDCHAAVHPNQFHFLAGLRTGEAYQTELPVCCAISNDKCIQPLRGGHLHSNNAVRSFLRRCPDHSGRCSYRGASDAYACFHL